MAKREKRDYYVLDMPEGNPSIGQRIAKTAIVVLRDMAKQGVYYLSQKRLAFEVIARDPEVKQYYMATHDLSYFRKTFQKLVKDGTLVKFKALGNNKNVYYALPEVFERRLSRAVVATPTGGYPQTPTAKTRVSYDDGDEEDFLEEE